MRGFLLALVAMIAFTVPAFADTALRMQDPEKFCNEIFGTPPQINAPDAGKKIATTIGKPEFADTLEKALRIMDGKKVDIFRKVKDEDFGGALRQMIYYAYLQDLGFIYFRFNFKLTSTGWILAHFSFKSETQELFPKEFP